VQHEGTRHAQFAERALRDHYTVSFFPSTSIHPGVDQPQDVGTSQPCHQDVDPTSTSILIRHESGFIQSPASSNSVGQFWGHFESPGGGIRSAVVPNPRNSKPPRRLRDVLVKITVASTRWGMVESRPDGCIRQSQWQFDPSARLSGHEWIFEQYLVGVGQSKEC
jgi:hypothetical protein